MPRFRYVGDDVRNFPTLGLYEVEPGFEFETDRVVASPLIVTADGEPTHVDADGNELGEPDNNADPNPRAGLAPLETSEIDDEEPIAERTLEDLTMAELYELAQDLELHGRSSMDKDELIAALREAATETPDSTEPVAGEGDDLEPQE